jgi:DNA end-binding protein Ku
MAARPYWKGQIRLALVSIPVEIYSATRSGATVAFNQIHEPSGKRIKYEKVVPGIGAVEPEDIVKGYEYSKGHYVLLDDDELEAVKLESKKTLELTQFVDAHEIDPLYYERPYYVVPSDDLAEEAFVVLREALRDTKKVGLGQLAMRGREEGASQGPGEEGGAGAQAGLTWPAPPKPPTRSPPTTASATSRRRRSPRARSRRRGRRT